MESPKLDTVSSSSPSRSDHLYRPDKNPIFNEVPKVDVSSPEDGSLTIETTSLRAARSRGSPSTQQSIRIEPDDSLNDEEFNATTEADYAFSVASDIRRGVMENGRLYASYGRHKPWIPIDESEMDRNDLQHCKFTLLMGSRLHLAPIKADPGKILDLGTGTGIWAIDMADKHESSSVIGVDIAAVQPSLVPPNLQFEIEDIEADWLWEPDSFDFIHARELVLTIRDWPRLIEQAFTHLKPGGYLEVSGSLPEFKSDDNTLPPSTAYAELAQIYFDMGQVIGASGKAPQWWKQIMLDAGFTDVVEKVYKVPTNPWPKDKVLKQVGAMELTQFREGISNIFSRGYTQILGGNPAYFQITMARARNEVMNRKMHSYLNFYVVYGKRPELPQQPKKTNDESANPEVKVASP